MWPAFTDKMVLHAVAALFGIEEGMQTPGVYAENGEYPLPVTADALPTLADFQRYQPVCESSHWFQSNDH